jgi:hypothetical protein
VIRSALALLVILSEAADANDLAAAIFAAVMGFLGETAANHAA